MIESGPYLPPIQKTTMANDKKKVLVCAQIQFMEIVFCGSIPTIPIRATILLAGKTSNGMDRVSFTL
jgi:hypothetical protein